MMISQNERYKKILNILKTSKPELGGIETIRENVINRIRGTRSRQSSISDLFESIFAWIYIGWVRRSLVAASILLILFFIYQQTMILQGVNIINKRAIISEAESFSVSKEEIGKQLMILRLTGRRISAGELSITEKQLEQLIDSYNELQEKYRDLVKIIEEDPMLKDYFEKKLDEGKTKKTNL